MLALVGLFVPIGIVIIYPDFFLPEGGIDFKYFTAFNFLFFLSALLILIPVLIAVLFKKQVAYDSFKLSFKSDNNYLDKYIKDKSPIFSTTGLLSV